MPATSALTGLQLNKSERLILVLLSYIFYGPLLWRSSARFINKTFETVVEARRQLREEEQRQQQHQQ